MPLDKFLVYPINITQASLLEKIILFFKAGLIYCNVCGSYTKMKITDSNLREDCICKKCRSFSRQRQLAYVINNVIGTYVNKQINSIKDIPKLTDYVIYNTEANAALHHSLSATANYLSSEYFGDTIKSGELINGIMHQDLMNLSFPDNSINLVISTEVFEHIPDPYKAHEEVYRVLKKGGSHIFTVPFFPPYYLDEKRAYINDAGEIVHILAPSYHEDPVRPDEGTLVYTIFSLEMLIKLKKIGFSTKMFHLRDATKGILGDNGIVFQATKL